MLHFVHLLLRIVRGMPVLVSSNWPAWILGVVAFVVTELLFYFNTPKPERRNRLNANLWIGVLVTLLGYGGILFAWSTLQTVYDDHHDNIWRLQSTVKEKDGLKKLLSDRDDYIKTLQARTCPQ